MSLELVKCPVCDGCGYTLTPDYSGGPFADVRVVKEPCDGCCGECYIPVEMPDTCLECGSHDICACIPF